MSIQTTNMSLNGYMGASSQLYNEDALLIKSTVDGVTVIDEFEITSNETAILKQ